MKKPITQIIRGTYILVGVLLLGLIIRHQIAWEYFEYRKAVVTLNDINTSNVLETPTSRWGTHVIFPNNEWIVIYATASTSRLRGPNTMAMARDSDDRWYYCTKHFYGTFTAAKLGHRYAKESQEVFRQGLIEQSELDELLSTNNFKDEQLYAYKMFAANDLDEARDWLLKLGFDEVSKPQ